MSIVSHGLPELEEVQKAFLYFTRGPAHSAGECSEIRKKEVSNLPFYSTFAPSEEFVGGCEKCPLACLERTWHALVAAAALHESNLGTSPSHPRSHR